MPNVIDSTLYIEGPFDQVERFVGLSLPRLLAVPEELGEHSRQWCEEHLGTEWVLLQSIATVAVTTDGKKTVAVEYESAWTPPCQLFHKAVSQHRSLQFHLQWLDQDGGLCPDPLFGGDDTVYYKCFGELYTSPIGNITWFKDEDQGSFSFVCVNSRDTIDITASWFTERGIDVKTLTEADGLRLVRAAHPDHAVFVARSATEDECLNRAVVDRVEKLNELIAETWGTDWFPGNNKVRGEVRFEDLSGDEYDRLIAERYPVCILCRYPLPSRWNEGPYLCECPPMTDEEKKTELERRHAKALADRIQSDDATDYFANLARQSERE